MRINSTTAYIVNKNTVKQLIEELLKSGYTLKDDIRFVTNNFGRMIDKGYYIPIFPRHPLFNTGHLTVNLVWQR